MGPIEGALAFCARLVLRFRGTVIVVGIVAAAASAYYAATRLGINTDTANMISAELPWRRNFIDYRASFPSRDRNIVVVIDGPSTEAVDAFSSALVERLRRRPDLYRSVFAARSDEFFERNGLLYSSVEELEDLGDRLAAAQPLIGLLRPGLDGAAVVNVVDRTLTAADGEGGDPLANALYGELTGAVTAVLDGGRDPIDWRRLIAGGAAAEGTRRTILLQPVLDFDSVRPAAAPMEHLRAAIDALATGELRGVTARLTGAVAMEHEEMLSVRQGANVAGVVSFVLVVFLLYATLRSWKLLAISATTLVAGLTGAAAFAAAAVGHLNLLSAAFAVMYIGLGTDFIIHVCLRVKELLAEGVALDDAIVRTVGGIGSSLVIAAVTTAAGFYAFIPTAFDGVSELGIISGTGMFISLFASLTLLPALLGRFLTPADCRPRPAWIGTLGFKRLTARPPIVLGVTAVMLLTTLTALPFTEFDSNPLHMRDPESESVRALEELAADSEAALFNMVAIAPDHDTALEWAAALRGLDTVRRVSTVDTLVPEQQAEKALVLEDIALLMGPGFADLKRTPADPERLHDAFRALHDDLEGATGRGAAAGELRKAVDALLAALGTHDEPERTRTLVALDEAVVGDLPRELERLAKGLGAQPFDRDALPPALLERWVSADGRELIEIAPREDVSDNGEAARFADSVRSIVPSATGLPVVYREASRTVVHAFQLALVYALVMVTILLWVFLRRGKDVLLVIVPILLATAATLAVTVLLGVPLNFASIIGLPLLVGIGVDNGIHIVHRMRTHPTADGEPFGTSTSLAVLASNLTTVVSFGTLGLSAHRGMASLGQLLTLGIVMTLAASMVLLPALLKLRPFR
ncbi:MAG TPA: MMPL family transporter [Gammaproteobacteria bacterium]